MLPSPALSRRSRLLCIASSLGTGALALATLTASAGCGGAPASPPVTPVAQQPVSPSSALSEEPVAPAAGSKDGAADSANYDVVKGKDPTNLKPLFEKGAAPAFPAATTSEQDCWRTISVVGSARQDYDTITTKCGASTGALQYVKPAIGHLHHKQQRRDTFVVPIQGGLCYRVFGVGDSTINDLDILIEQRGSLVGDDKTNGPVAIIESEKAWCMERDGVYNFLVQVHGEGQGHYVFGIWARKDTK
ncbi:MAG TPA: hypothetical protein VK762_28645 [Polyangiaceae bacterium]|jgi:hypothetical protein|nr:hypothetical protein [Polyangiaceae bacterium]